MRAKIILPNFFAVLLLGLGGFFFLKGQLEGQAQNRLSRQLAITSSLYARSEGLHGFELLNDVRTFAMSKDVVKAFAPVDIKPEEGEGEQSVNKKIHEEWFKRCLKAIELYTELWVEERGKRPELVFLTDRKGMVIARNITPNACPAGTNVEQAIPVVERALDGEATYALWSVDDSRLSSKKADPKYCQLMNTGLLEMAAAPVWYEDDIAGALVAGFEVSNGTAQKKSEMLGLDVAVLTGGEVYSSSFLTDTARQSLEQQVKRDDVAKKIEAAVLSGVTSDVFDIDVESQPYLAIVSPAVSADKNDRVVTVIMGSVSQAAEDVDSLRAIIVLTIVALLLVFVAGMLLTNHFLKPVMDIEEGLLKVLNGAYDYRFDVKSAEVGGLSYRINQLIGVLTGEDEDESNGA